MAVYDTLKTKETRFHRNLKDAYGKVHVASPSLTMVDAIRLTPPEDTYYYKDEYKKKRIILHFTQGLLHGDIGELTRPDMHVSVAYVVARDGTLYELFDPKYWSYHLGPKAAGGNTKGSRSSVAIEISNYGPLVEKADDPDTLYTRSNKAYCSKGQAEAYIKLETPFRGYEYFATFTSAQFRTVDSLVTRISRQFGILRKLPSLNDRTRHFSTAPGEGIWSHQNYRDDKLDVGPAFLWSKIAGR